MLAEQKLETILDYYRQPGVMTNPGPYTDLLLDLPTDVKSLVQTVQGLVLHIFWAKRYGVELSKEREAEVTLRPFQRKMARILELDDSPLTTARPLEKHLVGNCRDFSVITAAFLKRQGVAARARCGFGTYFLPNHYEDHWMVEYWLADSRLPDGGRWVQVDAQLDSFQQEVLQTSFDPLDMPEGQFVLAGKAWQMCRQGQANPDDFGIFDMHGMDFIKGNLFRDFLSLNRVEVLPWDFWGPVNVAVADMSADEMARCDAIAELTLAGNEAFDSLTRLYNETPLFHIPEDWSE
jgi:hypothetical protein